MRVLGASLDNKSLTDDELLAEAKEIFDTDFNYISSEYERAEDDIDFSLGSQWPETIRAQREKEGRPCLTENRIDVSIIQVVNDIRQTRPAINVSPQDDKADIETARVLKGIIRNIEQQSNANNAYDTAAENAVRGGYGWIRVNTRYSSPDSFDQEICIESIENPFSVLFDSNSRKLDGSDADHAFIFIDMPAKDFKKKYPKASPVNFEDTTAIKGWATKDTVRIAEYFYKTKTKFTLVRTPFGDMAKEDADKLGIPYDKQRESERETIKWCKFNGQEILEKTEWPGKYIPIIPVYGKVVWNDGRRKSFSLTYQGRDPQRRYNFHITAETEFTALQPKAPWLAYEDQLTGPQMKMFAESNVKNHAVLFHKSTYDKNNNLLPPPQRQQPPSGSNAMMQQAMVAADGIKATLGIFDASLGQRGNETSGKAILARQREGDNATFHFVDNLATSIRHVGRIIVDLIPKFYSGQQIARILGEDGTPEMVPLNQPVRKQGKGFVADPMSQYVIAPDAGKYDVSVDIGPSYATKRQEAVESMLEVARSDPRLLEVAGDLLFKSMDWPYAQEIGERIKKLLPPQLSDDNPEQAQLEQASQAMQQMQQQLMQMEAALKEKQDNQAFSNELELKKLELQNSIDQQKLEIEREKLALETLKAQDEISPVGFQALMQSITQINDNLNDVGQAVSMILDEAEAALGPQDIPQAMPVELAPAAPEAVAIPEGDMLV